MEGFCQYSSLAASRAPGTARADTETSVLLAGPGTIINTSDAGGNLLPRPERDSMLAGVPPAGCVFRNGVG